MRDFKTFKPQDPRIAKYISYYYIDFDDDPAASNEYICYPHFNTTLSFYECGTFKYADHHSQILPQEQAPFLKIFTPIREEPLMVSQVGPKKKVAIVFEPLGINHFVTADGYCNAEGYPSLFNAFDPYIDDVLRQIYKDGSIADATRLLDEFFVANLNSFNQPFLERALEIIHQEEKDTTIAHLAEDKLGISKRQLGRLFKHYLGTTPQKYWNIVQFRHALNYKVFQDSVKNYTELAFKAQYTDQSHFIKTCKQLTKFTPGVFFNKGEQVGTEDIFWVFTK